MRTTVTIDDALLREARELAARSGRRLGDVIDDALRVLLLKRSEASATEFRLPRSGGGGLQPGVDLEDKDALYELLDARDPDAAG